MQQKGSINNHTSKFVTFNIHGMLNQYLWGISEPAQESAALDEAVPTAELLPQLQILALVTQASEKADVGHEHTICNERDGTEQNI